MKTQTKQLLGLILILGVLCVGGIITEQNRTSFSSSEGQVVISQRNNSLSDARLEFGETIVSVLRDEGIPAYLMPPANDSAEHLVIQSGQCWRAGRLIDTLVTVGTISTGTLSLGIRISCQRDNRVIV